MSENAAWEVLSFQAASRNMSDNPPVFCWGARQRIHRCTKWAPQWARRQGSVSSSQRDESVSVSKVSDSPLLHQFRKNFKGHEISWNIPLTHMKSHWCLKRSHVAWPINASHESPLRTRSRGIPSEAPPKGLKWRCGATGRRCVHWRIAKTFDVEDALPISWSTYIYR